MKTEKLAEQLLRDRAEHAQREREREQARRAASKRDHGASLDPFNITHWETIAGGDPGYLPKTPMRMGKVGFWIACRACGEKFESKGMAYCETCLALPAEERRHMKPAGRPCEAPGCTNVLAPTARLDAKFCSEACRQRANRKPVE
jgi:hypothetical protein